MKVLLLGDSITQGLGSKRINFADELNDLLGENYEIINYAASGTTIMYVYSNMDFVIDSGCEVVCILYGNVDAQLKPNRKGHIFKYLPHRFKINDGSMLLPRPFYSHKKYKKILQRIENGVRTFFRTLIYKIDGIEQWVPFNDFQSIYDEVVQTLIKNDRKIILCSTVFIDNKLFPGTIEEYNKYNQFIKVTAEKNGGYYIDLYSTFENLVNVYGWDHCYNYDHFHPNAEGYRVMAKMLCDAIIEVGKMYNEEKSKRTN